MIYEDGSKYIINKPYSDKKIYGYVLFHIIDIVAYTIRDGKNEILLENVKKI